VAVWCAVVRRRRSAHAHVNARLTGACRTHTHTTTREERDDENTFLRRADRLAPMRTFRMCTNVEPPARAYAATTTTVTSTVHIARATPSHRHRPTTALHFPRVCVLG
jgi:hypothetical protein